MRPVRINKEYSTREQGQGDMASPHSDPDVLSGRSVSRAKLDNPGSECNVNISRDTSSGAGLTLKQLVRKQTLANQAQLTDVVRRGNALELGSFLEQKEGKVNVNFFDKEGQTALHQSCLEGNFESVKILIKFGADPTLANLDGWNPIHIATFGGHKDIVVYLLNIHS